MMEKVRSLELKSGEVAIFWLGQNSYVLKTSEGTIFAIDPYLSKSENYSYIHPEPPVKPEEFKVHFIFCTHDHLDHTDPIALPIIMKHSPNTIIFGSKETRNHLISLGVDSDRVKALEFNEPIHVRDLKVTAYYSIPPEEADTTHFGYLFEVEGVKIYNMGDTCQSVVKKPELILAPLMNVGLDVAILPIIGDTPQRRPEDALLWAKLIKPKVVIPSHYGCFRDRDIDPQRFVQLFKDYPEMKAVVIPYKGFYIYRK